MLGRFTIGMVNGFIHNIPDIIDRNDMIAGLHIFNAGMKGKPAQFIDGIFLHLRVLTAIGYKRTVIQRLDVKPGIKEGLHFRIGGNQFLYISLCIDEYHQDACLLLIQGIHKPSRPLHRLSLLHYQ